jgi:hypothetical protein
VFSALAARAMPDRAVVVTAAALARALLTVLGWSTGLAQTAEVVIDAAIPVASVPVVSVVDASTMTTAAPDVDEQSVEPTAAAPVVSETPAPSAVPVGARMPDSDSESESDRAIAEAAAAQWWQHTTPQVRLLLCSTRKRDKHNDVVSTFIPRAGVDVVRR